jgi:hypothetical protein
MVKTPGQSKELGGVIREACTVFPLHFGILKHSF